MQTERSMVRICEGTTTKQEMLAHSIEEYKEVFVRARNQFEKVIEVRVRYLLGEKSFLPHQSVQKYMQAGAGSGGDDENIGNPRGGGIGGNGGRSRNGSGAAARSITRGGSRGGNSRGRGWSSGNSGRGRGTSRSGSLSRSSRGRGGRGGGRSRRASARS